MNDDQELIEAYLDELAERLEGTPAQVRRVLAEYEAHLADALDAGLKEGLTGQDAARRAIERFGTPPLVAKASNRAARPLGTATVLAAAAMAVVRVTALAFVVAGLSAGVAHLVMALTSTRVVFGLPAAARMPLSACRHWLAVNPGATSCRQAGTLEASHDLTMGLALLGIVGIMLLGVVVVLRRWTASLALPATLTPAVAATAFGAAAVGLGVLGADNAVVFGVWGAGLWWTMAGCSLAACLACAAALARQLGRAYPEAGVRPG